MTDNREAHAGRCAPPEALAGCVEATGTDEGRVDPPSAADAGAGCAVAAADSAGEATPTPPATVREFERALRGLGFTRQQAQAIARHGFPGAEPTPPGTPDDPSLRHALQRLAVALKGTQ
jgi:hypothetical protein